MTTCSSCGTENPDGQKFCGECAAPLGAPARPSAEERKVAREIFDRLGAVPALAETDALLQEATALSS